MTPRFTLLLALALPAFAAFAAEDAASRKKAKELSEVRARIEAVQERVKQDRGRRDALENQLEEVEGEIAAAQQQLRAQRDRLAAQQRKVEETRALQAQAAAAVAEQRAALARQLRAAHGIGRSGPLRLLLNQEDMHKVGLVLAYHDYLHRARAGRIRGLLAQVEAMSNIGVQLDRELGELQELRTQQETALARLAETRAERALTVQNLAARIADALDELKALEADERRVQGLLDQLREALADVPVDNGPGRPFAKLRGKLPWPIRGKLLARFGQSKAGGKFSWRGLWIEAEEGAEVRASAGGRVAYVGWMQRYGLIAIVEHGGGYYTLYGHLQRVPRAEGETIKAGEVIGLAGNTGGYDKSGVYLEIRKGRDPVNPSDWLVK